MAAFPFVLPTLFLSSSTYGHSWRASCPHAVFWTMGLGYWYCMYVTPIECSPNHCSFPTQYRDYLEYIHMLPPHQHNWLASCLSSASFLRNNILTLCVIVLLTVSEVMRLHYARYPTEGPQAWVTQNRSWRASPRPALATSDTTFSNSCPWCPSLGLWPSASSRLSVSHSIILTICVAVIAMLSADAPPSVMSCVGR